MPDKLRLVSLMAENMDVFYSSLANWLARACEVLVEVEDSVRWQEREQMLDRGEAHVGFLCGLPYVWRADRHVPLVKLLAAPVMRGRRYLGKPVYFSDVVVRVDSPFHSFADLRGRSWAYNEPHSHSGYNLARYQLALLGERRGYFKHVVETGTHQSSLRMVAGGTIDGSAIDSTVFELERRLRPELAASVRVIATFGPSPIPPAVVSARLPIGLRRRLRERLLAMHRDRLGRQILEWAGIARFAAVSDSAYNPIRHMARVADGVRLGPISTDSRLGPRAVGRRSLGRVVNGSNAAAAG